jgi:hypothetical protein
MQCHNYKSVNSKICYKSHTRLLVTITITELKHKAVVGIVIHIYLNGVYN